jgi:signal transduction histidine kinase
MQSLRRTLSVRFAFTMFTALFVIALWAFLGARRVLRSELDVGLAAAAHIESAVLVVGHALPPIPSRSDPVAFQDVNRFAIVRDPAGNVLSVNTAVAGELPYDPAALAAARRDTVAWSTQPWRGEQVRSVYLAVDHDHPGDDRVIQVAASLGPLEGAARTMFLLMLGTVALGTVAATLGAGWLSRSATAPVAQIAAQAAAVAPGAVGQRITAHAEVEEFNRLVTVLNSMLERLDQGLLAQRRIISDVGHDLRTPITAMQGEVEIALRHPRSPEHYQQVLRSLLEEIGHLGTISDTLLLLARIETGELAPQRATTDVGDIVASAVRRTQQRVSDHPVTYQHPEVAIGPANVDRNMVGLVLDHLLDNAVRHTPPETPVRVVVAGEADAVSVSIEDEGPGVPRETLPHLFERFYRGDAARGRGGAGLGLTVAAAIVAAHGGTIGATPANGRGLRVTLRLPRTA